MSEGPYSACLTGKDTEPAVYGVSGPGNDLGYHGWYLCPENTFPTREAAEQAARMMNIAFRQGELRRAGQIRELLE